MRSIYLDRKIESNLFVVKARWFYVVGIFAIGILTKVLSKSNINFTTATMFIFAGGFIIFNIFLKYGFLSAREKENVMLLSFLSWFQVAAELLILTIVLHKAGGIESLSHIFFFLPVVSASLVFGLRGGLLVALIASLLVNSLVVLEYYGFIQHVPRYHFETLEFRSLNIGLTKSLTTSIFYMIIGFFSGYSISLLFKREEALDEKKEQLNEKTKLLAKREQKLSEINYQLFEAKNKITAIISNFADPIIFLDNNHKISLLNSPARDILGLDHDELGKSVSEVNNFSMDNFKKYIDIEYTTKKVEDANGEDFEEMTIKYKGQERVYKVMTIGVRDDDENDYGHIKVFYDLTREKTIDKLKSEFISIAAHQLRTPLTAIKWVIKMLLDGDAGKLNVDQAELLHKGYDSNERIINLVNDLLNVSRIEEGRFGYKFRKCSFQEVLDIVLTNSEQALKDSKQSLIINKPDKIPEIYMDPERVSLAVQNLLDNAIKYTPEGGKIEINIEAGKRFLRVNVKDTGVGIPEKDKEKIFSKFFRATNVVRMETEGTGLGLFIARNIIDKHGGQIYINSEEGVGTEVGFSLPFKNN